MATVNKKYSCQREVKEQLLSSHRKCVLDRKCSFASGRLLNSYLGSVPFQTKQNIVCVGI
eukprot:3074630-Ditylum_brightwellii.AAC.1